jgi:folate-binding protein YgfZ
MIRLDYLTIVEISDEDSQYFLENLLTISTNLEIGNSLSWPFNICDAKGYILFNGLLIKNRKDNFYLIIHKNLEDKCVDHLKKLVFRAKVRIKISSKIIYGLYSSFNESIKFFDKRHIKLTDSSLDNPNNEKTISDWLLDDLLEKIFFLDTQEIKINPFSLIFFGEIGINLKKGCFPGQEIFSRIYFRGKYKKTITILKNTTRFLEVGEKIKSIGQNNFSGCLIKCIKTNKFNYYMAEINNELLSENKFETQNNETLVTVT